MPVIESLLSIPETAKLARISPRTLQNLIAANRAPEVVRIGRAVRLRASDVSLWIKLGCPDRQRLEDEKARLQDG